MAHRKQKNLQNVFICTSSDTHLETRLGNPSNGTLETEKLLHKPH